MSIKAPKKLKYLFPNTTGKSRPTPKSSRRIPTNLVFILFSYIPKIYNDFFTNCSLIVPRAGELLKSSRNSFTFCNSISVNAVSKTFLI